MNRSERSNIILATLAREGTVDVERLVEELSVSPATVRRDLDSLAERQLLVRTHGGATRGSLAYDLPERYRLDDDGAKRAIASLASSLVSRGMVVGLSGGSTTDMLAQMLGMRADLRDDTGRAALTVVTNSVNIASTLAVRPHIKVVVSGGVMHPHSYELVGPFAEATLGQLTCDLSFIGVNGISEEGVYSVDEESEAVVNALIARRARRAYVVADGGKLGMSAFATLPAVPGLGLITDDGAPAQMISSLREAGTEVTVAVASSSLPASA
ncbi:MAG: DeoR/GlpR family DNA-binding transcription regulator [Arthrobacter sp.]|nr:DeoR/GlpR family DNA-binding transcription regulator [Arthrobacter sp.]